MEVILKYLDGVQQYQYLQRLLIGIVPHEDLPIVIGKIMDEVNVTFTEKIYKDLRKGKVVKGKKK